MSAMLSNWRPIEILLVEDSVDEAELTMQVLQEGRIRNRVYWVEDGEEAIHLIERIDAADDVVCPNIMLLDLNLPRTDGFQVLERLRRSRHCADISVVVMTSSGASVSTS